LAKCLKNYAHKKATAVETGIISDQITRHSLPQPTSTLTTLPVIMEQGKNYEYRSLF